MRHESVRVLLGAFVYKTQDKGKINNGKDSGKKLRDLRVIRKIRVAHHKRRRENT